MKRHREIPYIVTIAALLLAAASFWDLQISHAAVNRNSLYGRIFEAVGEVPASIIASFCAMGLMFMEKHQGKRFLLGMVSVVLAVTAAFFPVHYTGLPLGLSIVLGAVFLVIEYKLAKRCVNGHPEEFLAAAKTGLLMFLIGTAICQLMKFGWGRERYRHMAAAGSFEGFSKWFIPQRIASGNEFMSFPSSHSMEAAMTIWITLLPGFVDSLKQKELLLKIGAFAWMLLVMISRIVMGAHFLSDVTVGASIALAVFYALDRKAG